MQKIESQKSFWNNQHAVRGMSGAEGTNFAYIPNQSAIDFAGYLPKNASILELGCANGRDARWLASLGHTITGVDFAQVALDQMMAIAEEQSVNHLLTPIQCDYSLGKLPISGQNIFDGFYARSSLHTTESNLYQLMLQITIALKPGSIILIEGKDEGDPKIRTSEMFSNGLVVNWDEGGHVRRVWNNKYLSHLCSTFLWEPIHIHNADDVINRSASFVRLIARKSPHR